MKPTNIYYMKILTWIINKVCNGIFICTCTCNTGNTLTSKGRINLKVLLSTSIASAITAAEQLLEEMKSIHVTIIRLRAHLISEQIFTSSAH